MNKAKELLKELQDLDMDIQSRIDEINELEAGLLSSPKWSGVKVQGGQTRKVDDVYTQLVVMKEAIEQDTKEVINRKLELGRMINRLKNPKHTCREDSIKRLKQRNMLNYLQRRELWPRSPIRVFLRCLIRYLV